MKKLFLILFLVLFVTGCGQPEIQKFSLSNGHTLIVKSSKQTESVSLQYFLSGLQENETIPGLGSFCIRLMLKATQKHKPEVLANLIESSGGSIGGMWDYDYAGFALTATQKNFPALAQLLIEILNTPSLDEAEFLKLKKEILQEIKNRKEDAFDSAYEKLLQEMFAVAPLSGTLDSVSKISLKDVQTFYHNQIKIRPAVIAVVGNFNTSKIKELFSKQTTKKISNEKSKLVSNLNKPFKEVRVSGPFTAQTYLLGFFAPSLDSSDYAGFKVLNNLLGGKSSSRIFINIRERQGLGYALGSFYPSRKKFSHSVCYIQVDPRAGTLFPKLFLNEIEKLKKQDISKEELDAAINHVKGQFLMDHQTNARQSWYLAWFETMGLGWEYDALYPQMLQKISIQNIKALSQKYLIPAVGVRITH